MIKASGVTKKVNTSEGPLVILEGIDLEINQGESVAIVGASGSGKTTLLSLLAGLDSPSSGTITIGDRYEITQMSEAERAEVRGEMIGFVFQTFQLLGSLTALENVMLPSELRGDASAAKVARDLLGRVGLEHRTGHYPRQLSGGEQQRVAIARALANRPSLVLADEPTGSLDGTAGAKVADLLLEEAKTQNAAVLLATHDMELAGRADRIVRLRDGIIQPD